MSRRQLGISLAEVIVVTAIIIVLAALLMPVYLSAKKAVLRAKSKSNLRQIFIATEIYRQNWNGESNFGTSFAMGLPPIPQPDHLPILYELKPPMAPHPRSPEAGKLYYSLYLDPDIDGLSPTWEEYALDQQSAAVLYCDPFFNRPEYGIVGPSRLSRFVIGITVGGSIVTRNKRGEWTDRSWWTE